MSILTIRQLMLVISITVACNAAESMPPVSDLLDRYTQALDSTKSFIDHFEQSGEYSYRLRVGGSGPRFNVTADKGKNSERGQSRQDGRRFYNQMYRWGDINQTIRDIPEDSPYYWCKILQDKQFYWHTRRVNSSLSNGSASTYPYTKRKGVKPLLGPEGLFYLLGYVPTHPRVDTILRGAYNISVREETETIRGSACYVIDADTKYGQYTVWLDPEHGYHPARVRNRTKQGDYFKKRQLSKGDIGKAYLEVVRFEKVDGIWVPMEADVGYYRTDSSPQYFVKGDMHYKRTKIILNPDHDKLGSFNNPILEDPNNDPELINGTRVTINNSPIEYTWQNGKLVDDKGNIIIDCMSKKQPKK